VRLIYQNISFPSGNMRIYGPVIAKTWNVA